MKKDFLQKKIGIIGGGQLGKMMILEAKKLGFYVITLDPSCDCPSHSITDELIVADFNDEIAIANLAKATDVLTYEFEHINAEILIALERKGYEIYPTGLSLKNIQNKFVQKNILSENSIPVAEYLSISNVSDMLNFGETFGYPYLLKTCFGGYDGKGNIVVKNAEHMEYCFDFLGGGEFALLAEKFVDFEMEVSVLACRGIDGDISIFPVAQNKHIDNILYQTIVPANITETQKNMAMDIANKVLDIFKGVGMFCVEMFIARTGEVLVNEVAPRPHNSGHYSIEGCYVSQFQQHIRAITGLPLGDSSLVIPTVMMNLLGEDGYDGLACVQGLDKALALSGVNVHIYGKATTKPNRKMGHITCTDFNIQTAMEKSRASQKIYENSILLRCIMDKVGIIMGSDSDLIVMSEAAKILEKFDMAYEITIVSAHRTVDKMYDYATNAKKNNIKVIIAGAGGAAHLPGIVSAITPVPVIGVPVKSSNMSGIDSLYSIVQMPSGIPVATVAINGAANAALLALEIIGVYDDSIYQKLVNYKLELKNFVEDKALKLQQLGYKSYIEKYIN